MKSDNPNKMIAGRSYKEIILRYENKLQNPRITKTGKYSAKVIKEFLKIKTSLKNAPDKLNRFFKDIFQNCISCNFMIKTTNGKYLKNGPSLGNV